MTDAPAPGVSLQAVSKSFGKTAVLKDVTIDVPPGAFVTLLGPSGCGKSTLLRVIAGLELQSAGSVRIDDQPVDQFRAKQRDVAMVFQSYALYPHMTVHQNIALPLRMRRFTQMQRLPLIGRVMPGRAATQHAVDRDVLATAYALEIDHLLTRKPGQLSGGQRQRVAVARAMVRRPKVFLMDEPLSNLDAKLRVQMRAEIKALHRRLGITFIYVTHDQSEAMTMSDQVAVMMDGKLVQIAPPQDIYARPADLRVAAFVGSPTINLLAGTAANDGIALPGGHLAVNHSLENGAKVTVGIRPEDLSVRQSDGSQAIRGIVRDIEHLGADIFAHVDVSEADQLVTVRLDPAQHTTLVEGDALSFAPRHSGLLLFDSHGKRVAGADDPAARQRTNGIIKGGINPATDLSDLDLSETPTGPTGSISMGV